MDNKIKKSFGEITEEIEKIKANKVLDLVEHYFYNVKTDSVTLNVIDLKDWEKIRNNYR